MGFEAHGIDVSSEMIRRARCPEGAYDAVLCMGVLEYLPRYSRALAEIGRVLKPRRALGLRQAAQAGAPAARPPRPARARA